MDFLSQSNSEFLTLQGNYKCHLAGCFIFSSLTDCTTTFYKHPVVLQFQTKWVTLPIAVLTWHPKRDHRPYTMEIKITNPTRRVYSLRTICVQMHLHINIITLDALFWSKGIPNALRCLSKLSFNNHESHVLTNKEAAFQMNNKVMQVNSFQLVTRVSYKRR